MNRLNKSDSRIFIFVVCSLLRRRHLFKIEFSFEPQCQKYVPSDMSRNEDSDQPAHSLSLIRIFTGRQGCKVLACGQRGLIRLRGCAGWFELSLGAHVRRHVLSRDGSCVLTFTGIVDNNRLLQNRVDPDETAHNEPSHQDLRCLTFSLSAFQLKVCFKKQKKKQTTNVVWNLAPKEVMKWSNDDSQQNEHMQICWNAKIMLNSN